ncbi:RNA-binding S4 domain-containing protein [Salibacter sp.]|jgi:ribosome-associated protein|uniref:RNA-binding S4 domain-containing protein n=1 Tax=Salibacter sp. TaxID=2010995 RepID=UPI00287025D5|nr:RNA-binding S4 domain-containing protein [Salibacter sp.]MDR9397853.1 RNA-binding S4 domain-containing protein [Salibacter sp.]MDR9486625.1 RNA-binding S4 domain-containing protein [Salibacter sp.]
MEFTLQDDYIELIKVLKIVNLVASGGEAKLVVADGLVMVNDEVELRKRRKLRKGDVITFEGEEVTIV